MPKYIIRWNAGCGDSHDVVEATEYEEALDIACEAWRQEAETQAVYSAEEYTEEKAKILGLEDN